MNRYMDREAALQDFLEQHVFDQWQHDLFQIDTRYKEQQEQIETDFLSAFENLCRQAALLQEQGKKGEIHYLYISLLRTSIMENTSLYRLEAYDEQWFLDPTECFTLWSANFIFDPLFQRLADLETKKVAYARKITTMDVERIKQIEAVRYHLLALEFMKSRVPALLTSTAYQNLVKSPTIRLLAGEYRDQSEILYPPVEQPNEEILGKEEP